MTWQKSLFEFADFLVETAEVNTQPVYCRGHFDETTIVELPVKSGPVPSINYSSIVGIQFVYRLDELMRFAQVTEAAKIHLKKLVVLLYNHRLTPGEIVNFLMAPQLHKGQGPFSQLDFLNYETTLLELKMGVDLGEYIGEFAVSEMEFNIVWIQQIEAKYGHSDRLDQIRMKIETIFKKIGYRTYDTVN